ncbi:MAG TPA: adenosylcobinamide-GDP ribazoletransferase, partial [Methylovirgula sp.]|nr:adenosylcobinamide-GDP ribazoletransferase [Methylovirgula sp.]
TEQRLAIMKDSRIGAYGGLALVISILARFLALDALTVQGLGLACAVTISAAASSRLLALVPLYALLPLRSDGLGAATARLKEQDLIFATIVTLIISLLPLFAGAHPLRVIIALALSAAAAYGVTVWTRRLINGQTGDIAGATQQIAEITSYIVFTAQP